MCLVACGSGPLAGNLHGMAEGRGEYPCARRRPDTGPLGTLHHVKQQAGYPKLLYELAPSSRSPGPKL